MGRPPLSHWRATSDLGRLEDNIHEPGDLPFTLNATVGVCRIDASGNRPLCCYCLAQTTYLAHFGHDSAEGSDFNMTRILIIAATMLFATLSSAFAHHPLGGEVPTTAMHGLLSGIGHPIIGFDHLAFVIAVGLIAAFQSNRLVMPLGFVAGTVAGTMLTLAAVTLPLAEIVITGSVVGAGAVAMRGKSACLLPSTLLAALAGLFHGWAYGAAVVGAEATPLLAYLAGFGVTQLLIAVGVGILAREIWKVRSVNALQPRLAGALVAGVGLAYLIENVEGMIFPGM